MHAMVSSVDAVAIDQMLAAVAALAEPGDSRKLQQRRTDALVDMLLGRISNGCATLWDTNSDAADDDEPVDEGGSDVLEVGGRTELTADVCHDVSSQADGPGSDSAGNGELGADPDPDPNRDPEIGNSDDGDSDDRDNEASVVPEIDDWELPASAFRPTGRWLAPVHPAQGQRVRRRAWAPSAGHPQRASHPAGAGEHRHCRVGSVAVRVHGHSGPTDGSLLPRRRRCGISQRSRARLHQPDLRGAVVAVRPETRDPGTRGSNHCKQSRRGMPL